LRQRSRWLRIIATIGSTTVGEHRHDVVERTRGSTTVGERRIDVDERTRSVGVLELVKPYVDPGDLLPRRMIWLCELDSSALAVAARDPSIIKAAAHQFQPPSGAAAHATSIVFALINIERRPYLVAAVRIICINSQIARAEE